jgi:hypothetical protein
MNQTERRKLASKVIEISTIVGVALFLTIATNYILKKVTPEPTPPVSEVKVVPIPYNEKDTIEKVVVVKNFKNTVLGEVPTNDFTKRITVSGSIDHGYIFVKANVNGKALTRYDKVYMVIVNNHTGKKIGGRLVLDKSLETTKSDLTTEFLYDLSNVQYEQGGKDGYETTSGDWLKMLNQNQYETKSIIGFSSTLRNGEIEEVDISYACSTGSNCSITIQ